LLADPDEVGMRNLLQCLDVLTVRSAEVTFDGVLLEAELAPLLRLGGGSFRRGRRRLVLRGSDPRHQEHDQHPNPEHASEPPRVSPGFNLHRMAEATPNPDLPASTVRGPHTPTACPELAFRCRVECPSPGCSWTRGPPRP